MPSPFFVDPMNDQGANLAGLGGMIGEAAQQKKNLLKQQQMETEIVDAYNTEDPNRIAEVSMKYPTLAENFSKGLGIGDAMQKAQAVDFATQILSTDDDARKAQLFEERIMNLDAEGRDPVNTKRLYDLFQTDPDAAIKEMTIGLASMDPQAYEAYMTAETPADLETKPGAVTDMGKLAQDRDQGYINDEQYRQGIAALADETEDTFTLASTLRQEMTKQSSDFTTIADSYDRVTASEPTPAGDLAMLFNYNKMLDPGSVVRPSEFAEAAATGSLGERMKAAIGRVVTGRRLTDNQRNDFMRQAQNIFKTSQERNQNDMNWFVQIGEEKNIPREWLVIDRGAYPEYEFEEYSWEDELQDTGLSPDQNATDTPVDQAAVDAELARRGL